VEARQGATFAVDAERPFVAALWQAWEEGRPEVEQRALLDAADSQSVRLVDVFKHCPAWRRLIVSPAHGVYRLPDWPPPPSTPSPAPEEPCTP